MLQTERWFWQIGGHSSFQVDYVGKRLLLWWVLCKVPQGALEKLYRTYECLKTPPAKGFKTTVVFPFEKNIEENGSNFELIFSCSLNSTGFPKWHNIKVILTFTSSLQGVFENPRNKPSKTSHSNQVQKLSIEIPRWTSADYSFILPESSFFLQFLIHQTRFTSKWLWQSNFPEKIPEDRSREGRQPAACSHAHLPTPAVVRLLKAKQLRTSMIPSW